MLQDEIIHIFGRSAAAIIYHYVLLLFFVKRRPQFTPELFHITSGLNQDVWHHKVWLSTVKYLLHNTKGHIITTDYDIVFLPAQESAISDLAFKPFFLS